MARLLLVTFFLATSAAIVSAECPGGYIQRESGNCYRAWQEQKHSCYYARNRCEEEGGWLVTIRNYDDQVWVNNFYRQHKGGPCGDKYWIGANDVSEEGHFRWQQDDSDVEFTRWTGGQPDNYYNEDCVVVNSNNMSWYDKWRKDVFFCFVCEMFPRSC
ncbi:perlucin-like protein [Patiria miniata]|uniref:C-type lectin domain-containing protein n=1 Tax=Patiria miniata TaxID=46514 RepID=A0A914A3C8_PATMI|nr:perlucin-like protein [Patiria miniata]